MEAKYLAFIAATMLFVPIATWLGGAYRSVEKLLVAGAFLSTAYLVDVNFVSTELYRGDTRGFEIGLTDWMVLSLLGVMLTSSRWKNKVFTFFPPNSGLLGVYLLLTVASFFVAYVQLYSGFGLMKLIRGLTVFIVAYNYLNNEENLKFITYVLVAIVAIEFVFVIEQRLSGIYRASGTTPHSNTLAGYINMINMILFSLLLGEKRHLKLYGIAVAAGSLMVLASFSRGAIAAMAVGYGIVILLSYKDKIDARKTRILFVMALLALPGLIKVGPALAERFLYAAEESGESRNFANIAAKAIANDHILGVGINNYSYVINETDYVEFIDNPVDRGIVHNVFLLHACELGWGGMLIYILLIGNFLRLGYRSIGKSASGLVGSMAVGMTTAIFILSLQGSLEWFFRQTYITIEFFMIAGFLVALPKVINNQNKQKKIQQLMRQAI
jgi:hypothetical protein